jgi:hypothetical protein
VAVLLWLFAIGLTVGGLALDVTIASSADPKGTVVPIDLVIPLIIIAFATTGLFIAMRRPGHMMGRIYLISGFLGGMYVFSRIYSLAAKLEGWPGYVYGRLGEQVFYFPWIVSMVALPIMLFPDGRLPSRGWRWLRWVMALFVLWLVAAPFAFPAIEATVADVRLIDSNAVTEIEGGVVITTDDEPRTTATEVVTTPAGDLLLVDEEVSFVTESSPEILTDDGSLSNPLAIDALAPPPFLSTISQMLGFVMLITILGAAPAALVTRFRRSERIERQQLKWLVYPAAIAGTGLTLTYTVGELSAAFDSWWLQSIVAISLFAVLMIPVATAMAIVRYRLYDIDRLISRTVVYGLLVTLLVGTYLGVVFLFSQFVPDDSNVTVAIATLAVAALFNPLRRRIQSFIDRRLYRSRYDAQEIVENFSDRLQDDVEFEMIRDELLEVVDETVKPEAAALWIRDS